MNSPRSWHSGRKQSLDSSSFQLETQCFPLPLATLMTEPIVRRLSLHWYMFRPIPDGGRTRGRVPAQAPAHSTLAPMLGSFWPTPDLTPRSPRWPRPTDSVPGLSLRVALLVPGAHPWQLTSSFTPEGTFFSSIFFVTMMWLRLRYVHCV